MGRVQLFEVFLSHGRVVYSPGEPLAGSVRVRLGAPLPFRGGRGVASGEGRAGGAQVAAQHLRRGRRSRKRQLVALGLHPRNWRRLLPPPPFPSRLPGESWAPPASGRVGVRRAGRRRPAGVGGCWQMGRSREARVAQSFRKCPSCSLLGSARVGGGGLDPAPLGDGHSDLDTRTPPTLSVGSAGSAAPCTCWAFTWSLAQAGLSLPHVQAPGAGPQSSAPRYTRFHPG